LGGFEMDLTRGQISPAGVFIGLKGKDGEKGEESKMCFTQRRKGRQGKYNSLCELGAFA
jgi:hypothetical protein